MRDSSKKIRIGLAVSLLAATTLFNFWLGSEGQYYRVILLNIGVNIILASSLNLVNGFTGQFNMGHAGFMAVGAYTSAFITLYFAPGADPTAFSAGTGLGALLFLFTTLLGGLMAAAAGWVVGLPSLRLQGDYLGIVTLGFGEIIRVVIQTTDAVGGARGLTGIPTHAGFGWIYAWVAVTVLVLYRVTRSSGGRAMMAVREDEIAARAMGIDTTRYKVQAFVIASFFAGVAGSLSAHYLNVITPQSFTYVKSFEVIMMVVLGGMGSLSGSILAAVLLSLMPEALRPLQDYTLLDLRMVLYSVMLITLMLTRPYGIFGSKDVWEFRFNELGPLGRFLVGLGGLVALIGPARGGSVSGQLVVVGVGVGLAALGQALISRPSPGRA